MTVDHRVAWDDAQVARLLPGSAALRPRVQVLDSEFLDGAERERVRVRLQAWLDAQVAPIWRRCSPLRPWRAPTPRCAVHSTA